MAPFETYQSNAAEAPIMRKWFFFALMLSLLLHAGLYFYFQTQQLAGFGEVPIEAAAPVPFVVNKVVIDARLLEPPKVVAPVKVPNKLSNVSKVLDSDKPQFKEIQMKPQALPSSAILESEKPDTSPLNFDSIAKRDAESAGKADRELGSLAATLLNTSMKSVNQPTITVPRGSANGDGIGGPEGIPGRQSLDDALARIGTPGATNAPVAMPGGALFEHGSADLRPEALEALEKIGQLIAAYPKATFVISGHTDWTGTAEINQALSERRAGAVKDWLMAHLKIAPERIQTVGRGTLDAIVPATKSVDEQLPNRRVEIVIKTRKKG